MVAFRNLNVVFDERIMKLSDFTPSVILVPANDPTRRIVIADKLERPAGFAATNDDLWVSDSGAIVWQIVADGKRLKKPIQVASGLSTPEGLALRNGHLLVVESGAGRLSEINLSTNKVRTIVTGLLLGPNGASNQPAFHFFNGVAVGESGAVYVTGDQTNVLYRFERTKEGLNGVNYFPLFYNGGKHERCVRPAISSFRAAIGHGADGSKST